MVDASVFPFVTNGNIYAPVMMVAEKAADMVLGNTPLPAETTEWYRHRPAAGSAEDGPRARDHRAAEASSLHPTGG